MALETSSDNTVCPRCGKMYGSRKGNFLVSYADLHKGTGYLPWCRDCIDQMYQQYYHNCEDEELAVHQMCRKLDLYWSKPIYNSVRGQKSSRTIMTRYISKINSVRFAGMSYDDTLKEEDAIWKFEPPKKESAKQEIPLENNDDDYEVTDEVAAFWGPGYTPSMYKQAEQRRQYWMSRMPDDIDIGTEALIRQICLLELDINRDRADGKSVDKSINALNNLLGSANLKPAQKKESSDTEISKMPLGVGLQEWEKWQPLPETPENQKDVYHRVKNIMTWFVGHFAAMTGVHNTYSKAYEEEMEKLRVKLPEIADEDDNTFLDNVFGGGESL